MSQRLIYQIIYPYFITINTFSRYHLFSRRKFALLLHKIIIEACKLKEFDMFAFCILSDHVHLLVKKQANATTESCVVWGDLANAGTEPRIVYERKQVGTSLESNHIMLGFEPSLPIPTAQVSAPARRMNQATISDLIYTIKSFFVREMRVKYSIKSRLWQSRYNFRIIDSDKRFINTLNYIRENYKKKGLSEKYSRYPFQFINDKLIDGFFN
jgi:hypothetical protein